MDFLSIALMIGLLEVLGGRLRDRAPAVAPRNSIQTGGCLVGLAPVRSLEPRQTYFRRSCGCNSIGCTV